MDEDIKRDRVIDKVEKEESQREVDNSKRKFLKLLGFRGGNFVRFYDERKFKFCCR